MIAVPGKAMKASRYLSSLKEKNLIPECLNSEQNSLFSSLKKKIDSRLELMWEITQCSLMLF